MKVIVAGSRSIKSYDDVAYAINRSGFHVEEIVSGGARGVDRLGEDWARVNNVSVKKFLPLWGKGKHAGLDRNVKMGEYADALVAVWDGESRGTRHMIEFMRSQGKPVFVYVPDSNITAEDLEVLL